MKFCIKITYFFLNFVNSCSHNDPVISDVNPSDISGSVSSNTAKTESWKMRVVTSIYFPNDVIEKFEWCKSKCSFQSSCSLALLMTEGCWLISLINTYSKNFDEIDFKEKIR